MRKTARRHKITHRGGNGRLPASDRAGVGACAVAPRVAFEHRPAPEPERDSPVELGIRGCYSAGAWEKSQSHDGFSACERGPRKDAVTFWDLIMYVKMLLGVSKLDG